MRKEGAGFVIGLLLGQTGLLRWLERAVWLGLVISAVLVTQHYQ